MNNKEKSSWLFRFRSRLKFISRIKTGMLKNAYLLGDNLAHIMINLGYLIKNSAFFHNAAVKCELTRKSLYDKILNDKKIAQQEIVYIEFGVYKGKSFNYWLESNQNQNSVFFGFDTFSGLPEDWGHLPKGSFNTGGNIPFFNDSRYKFLKGLFQDTLPEFLELNSNILRKRIIINFDADLYSSTLYTLWKVSNFLKPGDILIFDEFFSVVNASTEFRAFLDFQSINNIKYLVISKTTSHCAFEII